MQEQFLIHVAEWVHDIISVLSEQGRRFCFLIKDVFSSTGLGEERLKHTHLLHLLSPQLASIQKQ